MIQQQPTMNTLFEQLGLDSSDEAIDKFVKENQLPQSVKISDAPFWTDNQCKFLKNEFKEDAEWIPVIDDLNTRLHKDAMAFKNGEKAEERKQVGD